MRVIPAIDLRGGRCVRLFQGNFARETEYSRDPAGVAARYAELGVRDLHLVDLDGAQHGLQRNAAIVRRIAAESPLAVQLGGGIRDRDTVARWFEAGVDRCVIGSLAATEAQTVAEWIREFGPERIVLAADVRVGDDRTPLLTTHGWERTSHVTLWDCLARFADVGLRHALCTDVSRDGAMSGPNVDLYGAIVDRFGTLELQASGGVRGIDDLEALRAAGAAAAVTGRALLDGKLSRAEVRTFLQSA